jgi:hypothetical protein
MMLLPARVAIKAQGASGSLSQMPIEIVGECHAVL